MTNNAFVAWQVVEKPWEIERQILNSGLPLPLNVRDNPCEEHTRLVKQVRANAVARARALPVVTDSGGPRRSTQAATATRC